jgi:hypothetical protein
MNAARLNPQLEALVREFADWWAARGRELDKTGEVREPLYHYTTMAGLLGIVSNEEMWFTSILHLNDPSELGYGVNIAHDILEDEGDRSGNEHVARFCSWVSHVLLKAGGEIFSFYVASFSREPNDLGQWRAYSDNGRGVAIGLSPKLFEVVADPSTLAVTAKTLVANVTYDRAECERNFRESIQRAAGLIAKSRSHVASAAEAEEFGKALARELAAPMFRHAITCKHRAFEHERETRLLLVNDRAVLDPHARFRTRGSTLVPYLASGFRIRDPGAITKVIVGPAADELAEDAVGALLRRCGLSPDLVERSDIPYTAQ